MSRILDILVAIITLSLLVTTIILPINYLTTTISDLGFFMSTPILHHVLTSSIFIGAAIILGWWSIKKRKITGILYIIFLILYTITLFPILEWVAFWILCGWVIMRLIKND